jgi:hypothetical protein
MPLPASCAAKAYRDLLLAFAAMPIEASSTAAQVRDSLLTWFRCSCRPSNVTPVAFHCRIVWREELSGFLFSVYSRPSS